MAEKRMFSKSVVLSDAFLDMPPTARCLYFTLNMVADDDGFVDSPKSVMRQSGATEDDMKILLAKYFLIPFDTGVVVIRHWRINNYLRCDRYKETRYKEEKAQLEIKQDSSYEKNEFKVNTVSKPALIDREPRNDMERVEKVYLQNYRILYDKGVLNFENPVINWTASRKLLKSVIEKYGVDNIIEAVKKSLDNKFCTSNGYVLTTILSSGVLAGLLNVKDVSKAVANDSINDAEVFF